MKKPFSLHLTHLPKHGNGITAILGLIAIIAVLFSPFSFTSSVYAAPASQFNTCGSNDICVVVWATNVNVRECTSTNNTECPVIGTIAGGHQHVRAFCQLEGDTVTSSGFTNDLWTNVIADNDTNGWISNIFIVGSAAIANVPGCDA